MQTRHLHFQQLASTMDKAREESGSLDFLLVSAETQSQGRGTRGRPWQSPKGNVYLTIGVHRRHLPPTRMRFFPLEAANVLWDCVCAHLPPESRQNLRLKWPNDLLWEGRKTAGMLIESTVEHAFIGVGINVAEAPIIEDGGSRSACLAEAGAPSDCALSLASGFFQTLRQRLLEPMDEDSILDDWKKKALWNVPVRLRDRPGTPEVMPYALNSEGHLMVRFPDGREEILISEYLA